MHQVACLQRHRARRSRHQADPDQVIEDDVVGGQFTVLRVKLQAVAVAIHDGAEGIQDIAAAHIRVRHFAVLRREPGVGQEIGQLRARAGNRIIRGQRVLEHRIRHSGANRDVFACAGRKRFKACGQAVIGIAVGEDDLVLQVVGHHLAHRRRGRLRQGGKTRHQVGCAHAGRRSGKHDARGVGLDIFLGQLARLEHQVAGALLVVEDDRIVQAVRIEHQHRIADAAEVVHRLHGALAGVGRQHDVVGHHAVELFGQADVQPEPDRGLAGALIAGHVGKIGAPAGREVHVEHQLFAAEEHAVAAGAGVDHHVGNGAQVHAVHVHPVVAGAGDDLQSLDVEQLAQLDAGAVDALHRLAVGVQIGEHIEGVAQYRADDGHRIETGAAVDLDVGVFHIHQRVQIDRAGIVVALLGIFAALAGHAADGGDLVDHFDQVFVFVQGQERLDEEGVVAAVAVQADVGHVVVHFEVVVAVAAVDVHGERGALRHFRHDGDLAALDQHFLGRQHRADIELVVARTAENIDFLGSVVADDLVVAFACEQGHFFDGRIVQDQEIARVSERRAADIEQGFGVVKVDRLIGVGIAVEVGDQQSVAVRAVVQPAVVLELALRIERALVDGIELQQVVAGAALVGQRVLAIVARVMQLDEAAAGHIACHGDLVAVAVGAAVDVERGAAAGDVAAAVEHADLVGAGACLELHLAGKTLDLDRIDGDADTGADSGAPCYGAVQREGIGAATEVQAQVFHAQEGDLFGQPKAGQRPVRQHAALIDGCGAVVEHHRVDAKAGIEREPRGDTGQGEPVGAVAYRHGVVAGAGVHGGEARDGADQHAVVAGAGVADAGGPGMGAVDAEQVAPGAQRQVQFFGKVVADGAAHVQTGELGGGQATGAAVGPGKGVRIRLGVVDVDDVGAGAGIDRQAGAHIGEGVIGIADVDDVVARAGVQGDDALRQGVAYIDAVGLAAGHDGERLDVVVADANGAAAHAGDRGDVLVRLGLRGHDHRTLADGFLDHGVATERREQSGNVQAPLVGPGAIARVGAVNAGGERGGNRVHGIEWHAGGAHRQRVAGQRSAVAGQYRPHSGFLQVADASLQRDDAGGRIGIQADHAGGNRAALQHEVGAGAVGGQCDVVVEQAVEVGVANQFRNQAAGIDEAGAGLARTRGAQHVDGERTEFFQQQELRIDVILEQVVLRPQCIDRHRCRRLRSAVAALLPFQPALLGFSGVGVGVGPRDLVGQGLDQRHLLRVARVLGIVQGQGAAEPPEVHVPGVFGQQRGHQHRRHVGTRFVERGLEQIMLDAVDRYRLGNVAAVLRQRRRLRPGTCLGLDGGQVARVVDDEVTQVFLSVEEAAAEGVESEGLAVQGIDKGLEAQGSAFDPLDVGDRRGRHAGHVVDAAQGARIEQRELLHQFGRLAVGGAHSSVIRRLERGGQNVKVSD